MELIPPFVLGLVWILVSAYALTLGPQNAAALFSDDAYYYFKIASNVAHGLGPTFDGIHLTNGFHPLWLLALVPVFRLTASPEVGARVVLGICLALWGLAMAVAYGRARRLFGSPAALVAAAAIVAPSAGLVALTGLESALTILLVLVWASMEASARLVRGDARPGEAFRVGLLLGLTFLARLDTAFMILVFLGWAAAAGLRRRGARSLSSLAALFLPAAALALAYFTWNLAVFGHLMPITSSIKSSFPIPSFQWRARIQDPFLLAWFAQMGVLAAGSLALLLPRGRRLLGGGREPEGWRVTLALSLGALGQYVFAFLFVRAAHWHFASATPALALMLATLTRGLSLALPGRPREAAAWVAGAFCLALAAVGIGYRFELQRRPTAVVRSFFEAAVWARGHLPPGAILALTDSGTFGFYSGRRVINLDGYVNSYDFLVAERERRGREYFRRERINYLVLCWLPANLAARVSSGKPYTLADFRPGFILRDLHLGALNSATEIYRTAAYTGYGGGHPVPILIYRVTPRLID